MYIRLVFFLSILTLFACKNEKASESSTTSAAPVLTPPADYVQPPLIELADPEATKYATRYDEIMNELEKAVQSKDGTTIEKLKNEFNELEKKSSSMGTTLQGKDVETYSGFMEKRRNGINQLLSGK